MHSGLVDHAGVHSWGQIRQLEEGQDILQVGALLVGQWDRVDVVEVLFHCENEFQNVLSS